MPRELEKWRVGFSMRKGVVMAEGFIDKQGGNVKSWHKRWAKLLACENQEVYLIYFEVKSRELAAMHTQEVMAWFADQVTRLRKTPQQAWNPVLSSKGEVPIHKIGRLVLHKNESGQVEMLDLVPRGGSGVSRTWHFRPLLPKGGTRAPIYDYAALELWAEWILSAGNNIELEPRPEGEGEYIILKNTYDGIPVRLITKELTKGGFFKTVKAYLTTVALGSGGFGKFKIGMPITLGGGGGGPSRLVGIKELRTEIKLGRSKKDNQPKTGPTAMNDIMAELERAKLTRGHLVHLDLFTRPDTTGGKKVYVVLPLYYGIGEETLAALQSPAFNATRNAILRFIVKEVALDLAELHRHGYAHFDIKWGNILLDDAAAYLSDFGAAQTTPIKGGFYATPKFTAPEFDPAGIGQGFQPADIFAFGLTWCTLMLPGCPFFDNNFGVGANAAAYRDHTYPTLNAVDYFQQLRALDPQTYDYVYAKMLHPDPAARCTASELAAKMSEILGRDGERAAKEGLPQLLVAAKQQRAIILAAFAKAAKDRYWVDQLMRGH